MMEPGALAVAAMAVVTAATAAWYSRPPVYALDGERWLKVSLSTLLRGQIEAGGGTLDDWISSLREQVLFHPQGSCPENKLSFQREREHRGAISPEERRLVSELVELSTHAERFARLYETAESTDPLLDDPELLGDAYAVADWLGCSWEQVALWGSDAVPLHERIRDRAAVQWVIFANPLERGWHTLVELRSLLNDRCTWLESHDDVEWDSLTSQFDRIVWVCNDVSIHRVLRFLSSSGSGRDRTFGVLAMGCPMSGVAGHAELEPESVRDWFSSHFTHEKMDTELARTTPYFCLQWVDREIQPLGVDGLSVEGARFPVPPERQIAGQSEIEVVDFGVLPASEQQPIFLAKSLLLTVSGWITRRS